MAYVHEIINAAMDNCLDYKVTIIGSCAVVCEGFKSIVSFSDSEIIIRIAKINIVISGKNMLIKELSKGYLHVSGVIDSVVKVGEEA